MTMNKEAGHGGHLNVTITFDGRKLPFIVDTGAPVTVLDKSLESKLGKNYGTTSVSLAGGMKQKTGIYAPPKLYLGRTPLMSGSVVGTYDFKGHLMGILGMDYLQHYCIQLDFQSRKVRFLNASNLKTNELGQRYPLTFKNGYPYIQYAGLFGGNSNLLIDVGCNIDGLTDGGTHQFDGVYLPECRWNGHAYTDAILATVAHGNALGLRFLGRHLVTFDFPHHQMFLKQVSTSPSDLTSSEDGSESTQKSGIRFLMELMKKGELPGWPEDTKSAVYFQKPQISDFDAATFKLWNSANSISYHYAIVRATKASPWKVKRAWSADANDNVTQKFQVP